MEEIKIDTNTTSTGDYVLHAVIPRAIDKEILERAVAAIAKKFVEENTDKLIAKLDLSGMANLIAVYTAQKMSKENK